MGTFVYVKSCLARMSNRIVFELPTVHLYRLPVTHILCVELDKVHAVHLGTTLPVHRKAQPDNTLKRTLIEPFINHKVCNQLHAVQRYCVDEIIPHIVSDQPLDHKCSALHYQKKKQLMQPCIVLMSEKRVHHACCLLPISIGACVHLGKHRKVQSLDVSCSTAQTVVS